MTKIELDAILTLHLQKQISIKVDGVEIKSGKFLLYQNNLLSNNFYYDLTIERIKKIDSVKLPFPFEIEHYPEEGLVYFDYRLSSLTNDKKHLIGIDHLCGKLADPLKSSRYINKIVEIEFS